jgi:hypothetical protein
MITKFHNFINENNSSMKNDANRIKINGKFLPTTNSNGNLIADTEEKIRNFWKWFRKSKVVDSEGRPMVMYHGTQYSFNEFKDYSKVLSYKPTFWFTSDIKQAKYHSRGGKVIESYLSLQNPKINCEGNTTDIKTKEKYDGYVSFQGKWNSDNGKFDYSTIIETAYATKSSQIKSVTQNSGLFSSSKNSINEATVENDMYYYNIADNFYDKMIIELTDKNYISQKDGNILFKASEINTNYSDLLIIFTDVNSNKTKPTFGDNTFKGGYAFGTYKQYKVIVINNLWKAKEPERGILKDSFIHEFIHYLDFKRSKGYKPKWTEKTTVKDYYNAPTEYNAYYQEAASYIVNLLSDDKYLPHFKENYKTFGSFYKWMIEQVFDKHFISNLNDINKKKLQKRVYNIYDKFFNT